MLRDKSFLDQDEALSLRWEKAEYETKDGKSPQHCKETQAFLSGIERKHNLVLPSGLHTIGTHSFCWNTRDFKPCRQISTLETRQTKLFIKIFFFS